MIRLTSVAGRFARPLCAMSRVSGARFVSTVGSRRAMVAMRGSMVSGIQPFKSTISVPGVRFYSEGPPALTKDLVEGRIFDLLKNFDKVSDPEKVTAEASFADLGLDSLDVVEVLFFIEEEFSIEIPDQEADDIRTVGQAVEYILAQPDAL